MNAFTSRAWTSLEARLLSRPPVVHSTTRQVCGIGISNGKATGGFVYCQCPLVCSIESQSRRKCATQAVTGKMYTTFAWKLFLSFFPNTISFLPDNAKWERKYSLWLSTLLEAATANIIVASLTIVWKGIPIVLLLAQNITRSLGGTRSLSGLFAGGTEFEEEESSLDYKLFFFILWKHLAIHQKSPYTRKKHGQFQLIDVQCHVYRTGFNTWMLCRIFSWPSSPYLFFSFFF